MRDACSGHCDLLAPRGQQRSVFFLLQKRRGNWCSWNRRSCKDHSQQSAGVSGTPNADKNPGGLAGWPSGGFGPTFTPLPAAGDGGNKAPSALSPCAYFWQRVYKAKGLWGRNEEAWQTIHDAPVCAVVIRCCSAEGCCWVGQAWACHLGP